MTLLKAIEEVLNTVRKPLHVSEIYTEIVNRDLWSTSGKTPEATISAQLSSDLKKHGDASRFVRVSPQTFAMHDCTWNDDEKTKTNALQRHYIKSTRKRLAGYQGEDPRVNHERPSEH